MIREENLLENSKAKGLQLITGLRKLQEEFPLLSDVRGLGLMIGAEFRDENRKPIKDFAKKVTKHSQEEGLMLLTCGPWDNTVRFIPPLNVTEGQVNTALQTFGKAVEFAVQ